MTEPIQVLRHNCSHLHAVTFKYIGFAVNALFINVDHRLGQFQLGQQHVVLRRIQEYHPGERVAAANVDDQRLLGPLTAGVKGEQRITQFLGPPLHRLHRLHKIQVGQRGHHGDQNFIVAGIGPEGDAVHIAQFIAGIDHLTAGLFRKFAALSVEDHGHRCSRYTRISRNILCGYSSFFQILTRFSRQI